jgi:hypothetical protein
MYESAKVVLPLYPSTELYPSSTLYPGGIEVLVMSLPDAALDALSATVEDIIDGGVAYVRQELADPTTAWSVLLALALLVRLAIAAIAATRTRST